MKRYFKRKLYYWKTEYWTGGPEDLETRGLGEWGIEDLEYLRKWCIFKIIKLLYFKNTKEDYEDSFA